MKVNDGCHLKVGSVAGLLEDELGFFGMLVTKFPMVNGSFQVVESS